MENQNETFRYAYSASEQEEVRRIREKYMPQEDDKMEQLRKLHGSAGKKAQSRSITLGVVGALVLGTGMSLFMTDLSMLLGSWAMFVGIPVGVLGLLLVALAYPVYTRTLKRERQRIAPEILRLTDELLK